MNLEDFTSGLEAADRWCLGSVCLYTQECLCYLVILTASALNKHGAQIPEKKPPIAFNSYNFPLIRECFGKGQH